MHLAYMLLFLNLNLETAVTARLRIVAKHIPIILMPLYPRCKAHFMKAQICTIDLDMHAQADY